ncbi:MAG: hypothetical protein FWG29_09470 [Treponema sp.]|nr:hypothetical protein [Treponema sp.]
MAISPLDLQTLFTQADKVGKQNTAQREGAALLQSIQHIRIQQQTDEKIRSVNETQNTGDGSEAIDDNNGGRAGQEGHQGEHTEAKEENEEGEGVIRDPALGKNVDFSF